MADYQTEVITDSPVLYYRLDQLGLGVDGEVVTDLSGNALHGELGYEAQVGIGPALPNAPAWGHVSPIATDAASREFWGWTNATIYGFTGTCYISTPSDGAMTPTAGEFTVEEWLRPMDGLPLASNFPMAHKEGTGGVLLGASGGGEHIGGFCYDSAGTLFTVFDMSFVVTDRLEESFHVVVYRLGDALTLVINGTLRNTTTVTSGLPTRFTADPFHAHPASLAYTNARHDEVAYYDYALGVPRALVHYEAALNELTMRGEANIYTTALLSGADDPDPVVYPFRHNWSQPVVERFRWRTSVFKPTDGATGLRRQRSAPRRQVEYQHLLYNETLRQRFEARGFAGRTAVVQFEPDKVRFTALSSGATTAAFDTRYLDYEVGQQVLFYQDDDTYEYAVLTDVTDDGIEWDEPLTRNYTNVWVKPARVARLPVEQSVELHSDIYGDASTIYEYLTEDEPLNPRRIVPYTPTLTHYGRETFDLTTWQGHDWSELPTITFTSDRTELDDGTGVVSTKQYRWGSEMVQPYNMNLSGRETIARYLGWLYARAGQSSPFWMPTFRSDLTARATTGLANSELRVSGHNYTNLYANADTRLDLAFIYFDNTTITRRIVSATVDGNDDVLTLDAARPTLTNLRWLSFLRRVTLSSDDLEIAWETDAVVRVAFAVIDAPIDTAVGSPSASPSLSPSASASPSQSPSPSASPSA